MVHQDVKNYGKVYLDIESYEAINLNAWNYGMEYSDIKNYGEINLDSQNYGVLDPDE